MRKQVQLIFILFFTAFPLIEGCSDTVEVKVNHISSDTIKIAAGKKYKRSFIHHFIFGNHYRDLWATEVPVRVFDPAILKGGLKPVKVGGNIQTISLHLQDSTGQRYVLRSVDKDPSAILPVWLRTTFLNFIVTDQTSAANPYAALIVDDLAEVAGIYHTNPQYFYVPENMMLLPQAKALSGKMVLFEEKPNSSWVNSPEFGNPSGIITSPELFQLRFTDQQTQIDFKLFLRSRLFDMWINDWDRHSDQWEWLKFNLGDSVVYRPLPRDRDGAFYLFDDGLLPFLASRWWGNIKFQSFHPNYENVDGLLYNSSYVDNLMLTGFTLNDWEKSAIGLMGILTDSAIRASVKKWPEAVYRKVGEKTIKTLIARRNLLLYAAQLAYRSVNEKISIPATDEDEIIVAERTDKETILTIISVQTGKILFKNSFPSKITRKIQIHGLGGNDKITVKGESDKSVVIEVFGGDGEDEITDISTVKGYGKKTRIYDTRNGNKIDCGTEAADMTTDQMEDLSFNRTGLRNPK